MNEDTNIIKDLQGQRIDVFLELGATVESIATTVTLSMPGRGTFAIDEFGLVSFEKGRGND